MAIVDVVKYDGPPDIYAWKYPAQELGTWTQLIVNESQEAILFKGGQALDLFTAGRHTLSTENIPVLRKIVNLPFGGKSPFTAEVWYVNKVNSLDVKWGTRDPIQIQDPQYKVFIPIRSFGQFGLQIEDSRKFLVKLVGTLPVFDRKILNDYFRGVLTTKIKDIISTYIIHKKISVMDINAYISDISEHMQAEIEPAFSEYGIKILNFYVNSINIPEDDPAVLRLKEALAKKAEMDIIGYNYQQERSFNTMDKAAMNEGAGNSGFMGAGMGLGMGVGIGGVMGNTMGQIANQVHIDAKQSMCPKCNTPNPEGAKFCFSCGYDFMSARKEVENLITCDKCQTVIPSGAKFCPNCGNIYNPCPKCNADNPEGSIVCKKCGEPMPVKCSNCGERVQGGMKFCPNCGNSMVLKCSACNYEIQPGVKFCPNCGNKI